MTLASAISFEQARQLTGGKFGAVDAACPLCGPQRQSTANQRRKTLRLWCTDPEFITFHCARCEERGWTSATGATVLSPRSAPAIAADIQRRDQDEARQRREKALSLWRRRRPLAGTAAETYLRDARGYSGRIPATLGFLPGAPAFPPAMIAAFGMACETSPGDLAIADFAVRGVHLTSLQPDGRGKAGTKRDKIMIGKSSGAPIVLAPINDGMGLTIAEGIEDALSSHAMTGLGAWAAGSASRMPALADQIPAYVECVTVISDGDDVGRANARKLIAAIPARGRDLYLIAPPNRSAAA
jgi:hypothetical protein